MGGTGTTGPSAATGNTETTETMRHRLRGVIDSPVTPTMRGFKIRDQAICIFLIVIIE